MQNDFIEQMKNIRKIIKFKILLMQYVSSNMRYASMLEARLTAQLKNEWKLEIEPIFNKDMSLFEIDLSKKIKQIVDFILTDSSISKDAKDLAKNIESEYDLNANFIKSQKNGNKTILQLMEMTNKFDKEVIDALNIMTVDECKKVNDKIISKKIREAVIGIKLNESTKQLFEKMVTEPQDIAIKIDVLYSLFTKISLFFGKQKDEFISFYIRLFKISGLSFEQLKNDHLFWNIISLAVNNKNDKLVEYFIENSLLNSNLAIKISEDRYVSFITFLLRKGYNDYAKQLFFDDQYNVYGNNHFNSSNDVDNVLAAIESNDLDLALSFINSGKIEISVSYISRLMRAIYNFVFNPIYHNQNDSAKLQSLLEHFINIFDKIRDCLLTYISQNSTKVTGDCIQALIEVEQEYSFLFHQDGRIFDLQNMREQLVLTLSTIASQEVKEEFSKVKVAEIKK